MVSGERNRVKRAHGGREWARDKDKRRDEREGE